MPQVSRQEYSALFGPTVGDKIRLGDTDLYTAAAKACAPAWAATTARTAIPAYSTW